MKTQRIDKNKSKRVNLVLTERTLDIIRRWGEANGYTSISSSVRGMAIKNERELKKEDDK